jgi:hypothetical protein
MWGCHCEGWNLGQGGLFLYKLKLVHVSLLPRSEYCCNVWCVVCVVQMVAAHDYDIRLQVLQPAMCQSWLPTCKRRTAAGRAVCAVVASVLRSIDAPHSAGILCCARGCVKCNLQVLNTWWVWRVSLGGRQTTEVCDCCLTGWWTACLLPRC